MLAIDIGNTTIGLEIVQNGKVLASRRMDTIHQPHTLKLLLSRQFKYFSKKGYDCQRVVICSVVPETTVLVERYIKKIFSIDPYVVGRDIIVPIKNCYKKPSQVGQDRLVGAYAALKLYGKPLIIVDLGTAITFDVVSKKGEYLGGAIVPGIRLSAESLFLKTALLPQIDIRTPQNPIGKTTQESILSGLFYGYGVLCQGFIDLLARQLRARPKVVMTGGHTQLMKKFVSPKIRIIDQDLVFKGLYFLVPRNLNSSC
ncbi:MAG: type III pantothenate kinase [Candidatus Omnitrophica bacterium]|nr:type III pantothenate kinase [Candidatus Omnitrophota bacterium]